MTIKSSKEDHEMYSCETCHLILHRAEKLTHMDSFPHHRIRPVDQDDDYFEEIERQAEERGEL